MRGVAWIVPRRADARRTGLALAAALAALGLGAPRPTHAQEAAVDSGIVEACLAQAGPAEVAPDCIGMAARHCQATTPQGDTTTAIGFCLMAEGDVWDGLLNREYQTLRNHLSDQPGLGDTLLAAQRAWIAFRDAECTLAYDRWGGGSMRTISAATCRLDLTARRVFDLRAMQGH